MDRASFRTSMYLGLIPLLLISYPSSAEMINVASSPLSEFVIFSGGATPNIQSNFETEIGGHTLINGNIGSNQDLFLQGNPLPGYPAQLNGSAYVGGYLKMGQDLTVGSVSGPLREIVVNGGDDGAAPVNAVEADFLGNLYGNMYVTGQATGVTVDLGSAGNIRSLSDSSGGNLEFGGGTANYVVGNIDGSVSSPSTKTFSLISMPAATVFTAGGVPQQVDPALDELTLAPDVYGELLTSEQNQKVTLSSGDYYFDSIDAQGSFALEIDLTSGDPVEIYVVGDATFTQNSTLMVKGAGTGGVFVPISDAPELAALIYMETHGRFVMGGENVWGGTVYASLLESADPEVQIGQYIDWYGAAYAYDSIDIADHGTWTHVPVPEPATLGLLALGALGLLRRRR